MQKPYTFIFLKHKVTIHGSWAFIFKNLSSELSKIEDKIVLNDISSDLSVIFKVFEQPLDKIDVIILGQDPYPQKNSPTGLAFEVGAYTSWTTKTTNTSLRNILKHIYYLEKNKKQSIKHIRKQLLNETFQILPPNRFLKKLKNNGVFLLNTALTCKVNMPNSHKQLWHCFTNQIIEEISKKPNPKKWLLYGKEAQKYTSIIKANGSHNSILNYVHPVVGSFVTSQAMSHILQKLK